MGLRDLGRRLRSSVDDLDSVRLHGRFDGLGLDPIGEAPARQPIRVGGEIKRVLIAPRDGVPALEIMIGDGSGDVTAVFTGRRTIPGMTHGRAVVLEGVAYEERGRRILLNPAYTLLPH
jgi:hypothetical protein